MIRLETERLILRDMVESDIHNLHNLLSDHKNLYFMDDIYTNTLEESRANLETAMSNQDGHYFCIEHRDGTYIGQIGYTIQDTTPVGKIVHVGYFLLPEHQRKGYTPEAMKKVLEFAFSHDNCVRVTIGCYKDNAQSEKVMIKVGFRKEGERIHAQWHDGALKTRLDYAMNKEEYYERAKRV